MQGDFCIRFYVGFNTIVLIIFVDLIISDEMNFKVLVQVL